MLSRRAFGGIVTGAGVVGAPTERPTRSLDATFSELQSLAAAIRTSLAREQIAIRTAGFHAPGDGGGAFYRRVAVEPGHGGKFRSADGGWWELSEPTVTPQMFGAILDGIADDAFALAAAISYGRDIYFRGRLRLERDPGLITRQCLTGAGRAVDIGMEGASRIIKAFDGPLRVGDLGRLADLEVFAEPGAGGGDNIQVTGTRSVLTRVTSTAAARDGFRIGADDDDTLNANFWHMESCIALKSGRHGLHAHHTTSDLSRGSGGLPNCNAGMSIGFDARECGGSGIHLGNVRDCTFIGDGVQNNGSTGFMLAAGANGHKILGLYAEANNGSQGLPGDEVLISTGAIENLVLGLRCSQLGGAGLSDGNPPGQNAIDVFDAGAGRYTRRGGQTLLAERDDQHAHLALVVGQNRTAVSELVGRLEGVTGGSSTFWTKRNRNTPREAWSVDSRQTFTTFRAEASTGWDFVVPTASGRVDIAADSRGVDLEPAGALTALTVGLPLDPVDGQIIGINTTVRISALTVDGGGIPVRNGFGALPSGGGWTLRYRADRKAWYRQG